MGWRETIGRGAQRMMGGGRGSVEKELGAQAYGPVSMFRGLDKIDDATLQQLEARARAEGDQGTANALKAEMARRGAGQSSSGGAGSERVRQRMELARQKMQ